LIGRCSGVALTSLAVFYRSKPPFGGRRHKESNMKIGIIIGIALPLCTAPAFAAPVAYELKKDHTDISFKISHAGFTMKHGSFADITGSLNFDADHLDAGSVEVTVAINSILTNHVKRDHDLQGPNFLDAVQYPTMRFASTKVVQTGTDKLDVTGTLTLHGVSKPLTLHASINRIGPSPFGNAQTVGFSATGSLNRSDYGIKAALPMIGDEVAIDIDAEFAVPKAL
jgi:polyisoprenoid-binding protein YceI